MTLSMGYGNLSSTTTMRSKQLNIGNDLNVWVKGHIKFSNFIHL